MRKNILIFLTFVLLKLSSFSAGIHHDIKIAVFPFIQVMVLIRLIGKMAAII